MPRPRPLLGEIEPKPSDSKKELPGVGEEDAMAVAAQCYLSPHFARAKGMSQTASPKSPRRPMMLPALCSPASSDLQLPLQSGLPSPSVTSPGTIVLAPSRPVGHDLDLPMIDQICRSSFQAQKALLQWQRRALAAHRRAWDKAGRLEARTKTQRWRQQQIRTRKATQGAPPPLPSPRGQRKFTNLDSEDEGEAPTSHGSLALPTKEEGGGAARTATPRAAADPSPRPTHPPRSASVKAAKASKPEQSQHRLRHLLKRRQEKRSQRIAAAAETLEGLDPTVRSFLHEIFERNAKVKEDALMGLEVHRAVLEAGLVGHDAAERRSLAAACRPPGRLWEEDGLLFAEFAGKIVPSCRATLTAMRQEKLHKILAPAPREWTGRVSRTRLIEATIQVLPAEYVDASDETEEGSLGGPELQEIVRLYAEGAEGYSLAEVVPRLQVMSEEWWREQAQLKREVQERWDLDEETFTATGNEIVHLDAIFKRVDKDSKGYLDRNEVENVFDELGVVPSSLMQKRKTLGLLNEQSSYDFAKFIKLVDKIRWLIISQEDKQLHSSYMRMAAAHALTAHAATRRAMRRLKLSTLARSLEDTEAGTEQHQNLERDFEAEVDLQENEECGQLISYDQLVELLTEAAVLPEGSTTSHATFRRRRLVGREVMPAWKAIGRLERIMQDVDPSARQLFSYQEMRLVLQRMREETRQEARLVEAKHIIEMGYKPNQVEDMREMFRKLDPHGTGLLTEVQVEMALQSLSITLPHEACAAVAFRVFDFDLSGSIDFLEFLSMMTMARNQDGPFKSLETQLVTTLSKLDRGDLLLLLTVLKVPNSRLESISDTRLVYEASELLKISADKELPPIIGGRSLAVLVRYAEKSLKRAAFLP